MVGAGLGEHTRGSTVMSHEPPGVAGLGQASSKPASDRVGAGTRTDNSRKRHTEVVSMIMSHIRVPAPILTATPDQDR